ncbi:MAG: hypothetical protein ABSF15_29630 [Candidatus Sulfotelmatobacter sp.]
MVKRWPTWFNTKGDFRYTGMTLGLRHDDGWFDIIWRLCGDLEPLVAELEQATGLKFEILQVKEKFGGLRIHVNHANDAIRQRIEAAIQNPSIPAKSAVSRDYCEKVVGSKLFATSTRTKAKQVIMLNYSTRKNPTGVRLLHRNAWRINLHPPRVPSHACPPTARPNFGASALHTSCMLMGW